MPIQIIVVLFVALVVGGAILAFSRTTLDDARGQLNDRFKNDPDNKEIVIEVATATDETIIALGQECVKKSLGDVVEPTLCYALFADEFQVNNWAALDNIDVGSGFKLDTEAITVVPTAVRLTFNPGGTVDVTD
jgi:hypothetical protein